MPSPFLVILCGIPSSGKSTLAKRVADLFEDKYEYSVAVVASDTFRHLIPTYKYRFEPELERFIHGATYATIEEALRQDLLVISDDTNYYQSIRRRLVRIAEKSKAGYAVIFVDIPLQVAIEWNKKRGEPIPSSVIEEIYYKLDEPGKRYSWDKPMMTVDPSKTGAEELATTVTTQIHEKISALKISPIRKHQPTPPPLRTDLERETRRAMGEVMKRFKNLSVAKQVTDLRKSVVKEALEKKLSPQEATRLFFEQTASLFESLPHGMPSGRVMIHVGLFGHVDHGKTKLAACLTEIPSTASLDKHPQAQERGMSIDMGFSAFHLGKYLVTLVDLPGHYSLIKHVTAGANIIDMGILVVAADEGPNVQTIEHLQILDSLNIQRLVVAVNKTDLVDEKRLHQARDDVKKLLEGTQFHNSSIVHVSALKCEGIKELQDTLLKQISPPVRNWSGSLRIPISHSFNIMGIGTTAVGTVLQGRMKLGDTVEVQPSGKKCRVRFIQIFGEDVKEATAGDRVGIALADIRPENLSRGSVVVSPGSLKPKSLLEVKLEVEREFRFNILARSIVHVNIGMQTLTGTIYPYIELKDRKVIRREVDSESPHHAFIKLQSPAPVEVGDRAMLMKLDLPPNQSRIIGLAHVVDLPEVAPELYSAKVKRGVIKKKTSEDLYVVSGLFTKEGAKHVLGRNVITASKTKGTIVDPYGDQGDVLVRFEDTPSASEKVYWYKLRKTKIA